MLTIAVLISFLNNGDVAIHRFISLLHCLDKPHENNVVLCIFAFFMIDWLLTLLVGSAFHSPQHKKIKEDNSAIVLAINNLRESIERKS